MLRAWMDEQGRFLECAERLNQVRIDRALALLPPLQRHLFQLIAHLIHHNSVHYPGYLPAEVPAGIYGYHPTRLVSQA
ncbi:MAG: hypothetical protein ACRCSS_10565, partial [Shewanella sp.]